MTARTTGSSSTISTVSPVAGMFGRRGGWRKLRCDFTMMTRQIKPDR